MLKQICMVLFVCGWGVLPVSRVCAGSSVSLDMLQGGLINLSLNLSPQKGAHGLGIGLITSMDYTQQYRDLGKSQHRETDHYYSPYSGSYSITRTVTYAVTQEKTRVGASFHYSHALSRSFYLVLKPGLLYEGTYTSYIAPDRRKSDVKERVFADLTVLVQVNVLDTLILGGGYHANALCRGTVLSVGYYF